MSDWCDSVDDFAWEDDEEWMELDDPVERGSWDDGSPWVADESSWTNASHSGTPALIKRPLAGRRFSTYEDDDLQEENGDPSRTDATRDAILQAYLETGHDSGPKSNRVPTDVLLRDVVQLVLTEMGTTVGMSPVAWDVYFSLKAEALALTHHYRPCLLNSLASDMSHRVSKKSAVLPLTIRNMATQMIALYQLGYRVYAETLRRNLLMLSFEDILKSLSPRLLKMVEGTLDVLELVPALLASCVPARRSTRIREKGVAAPGRARARYPQRRSRNQRS